MYEWIDHGCMNHEHVMLFMCTKWQTNIKPRQNILILMYGKYIQMIILAMEIIGHMNANVNCIIGTI